MRRVTFLTCLAIAPVAAALSGCLTTQIVKDLPPEAKAEIAKMFIQRCGGTVNIGAGGGSGQLGGGFNANFQLTGTCPVPEATTIIPLKDLGRVEVAPIGPIEDPMAEAYDVLSQNPDSPDGP